MSTSSQTAIADPDTSGCDASDAAAVLCCPPLTEAALSESEAVELAALLKALADPVRVRLVSLAATAPDGELCACDLPEILGRSQPTISHHLTQLVEVGLLEREQRGKWAWFRLVTDRLSACRVALGECC